jgi:hypothetical protein
MSKGMELVIGIGKPKKPGAKGMADDAFAQYMKEKGKGGESAGGEDHGDEASPTAEMAGKSACEDFANAQKAGDHGGMWDAFKRMASAAEECSESPEEEAKEDSGDEPDDDGED